MSTILIYKKDGKRIEYPHESRPGGSYTNHVKYEGNFVVVIDVWGNQIVYPSYDIERVEVIPNRY